MRISPNHPRLRIIALACWALGAFCLLRGISISLAIPSAIAFSITAQLLAFLLFALGVAFWLIGADQRAGIVFDHKGLLLNLGNSSSFIAWDNIEQVGVSTYRSHLLSIGSRRQFGVALRDASLYAQSYEARVPAARGFLGKITRSIEWLLRPFQQPNDRPLFAQLAHNRRNTGFDVLIPEAFLGGRADSFANLVETYRKNARFQLQREVAM